MGQTYWFIRKAGAETVVTCSVADGVKRSEAVLVFTDKELADQFIEFGAHKHDGAEIGEAVCLEGDGLVKLLDTLQLPVISGRPAYKSIVINPDAIIWEPTHFPSRADVRGIAEFRRACEGSETAPTGTLKGD
jgi:hypothetical protein